MSRMIDILKSRKGKIQFVCILLFIIVMSLLFAGITFTKSRYSENQDIATPFVTLSIQGVSVQLDMSADRYCYETSMMTSEFPMDFTMSDFEGWELSIDNIPVYSGQTTQIQIPKLDKDLAVIIRYTNLYTGETGEQYIRTLPNAVRDYTVLSHVDDGVYYYAHDGYALKMDHTGSIIFYYADSSTTARYLNEFRKVELKDQTYYLLTAYHNSHQWPELGEGAGPNAKEIILDERYYPVTTVESLYETQRTPAGIPLDQHEFLMLDEGHYILCGYVPV